MNRVATSYSWLGIGLLVAGLIVVSVVFTSAAVDPVKITSELPDVAVELYGEPNTTSSRGGLNTPRLHDVLSSDEQTLLIVFSPADCTMLMQYNKKIPAAAQNIFRPQQAIVGLALNTSVQEMSTLIDKHELTFPAMVAPSRAQAQELYQAVQIAETPLALLVEGSDMRGAVSLVGSNQQVERRLKKLKNASSGSSTTNNVISKR